jgi:hypothetical protein
MKKLYYECLVSLGSISETSEDRGEEAAQARNDEIAGSGKTLQTKSQNTISEEEKRELHKRIDSLEHDLKVPFVK